MQALGERIRPVLTINKIDRCFLELMLDPEEAYLAYRRVIENANVIMATYADEHLGDTQVRGRHNGAGCAGQHKNGLVEKAKMAARTPLVSARLACFPCPLSCLSPPSW